MEQVKNWALETLFELKRQQLNGIKSRGMLQRIPAQFCDMVCHIGFHAECAPPEGMMHLICFGIIVLNEPEHNVKKRRKILVNTSCVQSQNTERASTLQVQ